MNTFDATNKNMINQINHRKISILKNAISNIEKSNMRHMQKYNQEDDIGNMFICVLEAHINKIELGEIEQQQLENDLENDLESDLRTFVMKYLNDINIDQFRNMLDPNKPGCCSPDCLRILLKWYLIE
jgi:hypothetical protein